MTQANKTVGLNLAEQYLENLKVGYLDALPERCNEQELLVLALRDEEANIQESFNALYGNIHSLKGSAGTYGIQVITVICHKFEDYLEIMNGDYNEVDSEFINQCLAYVDLIRKAALEATQDHPNYQAVQNELETIGPIIDSSLIQEKHVLIIESSATMAMLYSNALENFPLKISKIQDGLQGLGLLMHKQFDFMITGKEAKTLNGAAIISALKASESINSSIKTIMISSTNDLNFGKGAEPDYVVQKNKEIASELCDAVKKIIC